MQTRRFPGALESAATEGAAPPVSADRRERVMARGPAHPSLLGTLVRRPKERPRCELCVHGPRCFAASRRDRAGDRRGSHAA